MVELSDLSVVFQPIVDLKDGSLFGHEALVRCQVDALRNPMVLFERSVELGCTGRLGRMIREIGVPHGSGMPLFVNIHPTELTEEWLVRLDDPIFAHDDDVYLEVTESVPMTHFDICNSVLKEVGSRGAVDRVVDDFGAGYSNILRIADLNPSIVKLDRSLIIDLDRKPRRQELVTAVVEMCVRLGAKVVAEGIETPMELIAVRETGAHYAQGFLLARPGFPAPPVVWPLGSSGQVTVPPPTMPSAD
jgi:EAL domain-containing protein (putative c-di-GMP-specific phosphodiesterase class I)